MQKFLLNINGSKEHQLYALYLVHLANLNYDEVEFNIIAPESSVPNFSVFSPFEVHTYSYSKKEGSSLPQAHKFAYNLNEVFNINYFIDFDESTTSAFWGTAFRAKERIGKASRMRNMLLTKSIKGETFQTFFDQVVSYFGWDFDFSQLQKEFEVNGDDVLVFEKVLSEDLRTLISNKFVMQEFTQDEKNTDETLSKIAKKIDQIQYVIVNSKEDIGLFRYLNKIVVFDDTESTGEVISLDAFISQHVNKT